MLLGALSRPLLLLGLGTRSVLLGLLISRGAALLMALVSLRVYKEATAQRRAIPSRKRPLNARSRGAHLHVLQAWMIGREAWRMLNVWVHRAPLLSHESAHTWRETYCIAFDPVLQRPLVTLRRSDTCTRYTTHCSLRPPHTNQPHTRSFGLAQAASNSNLCLSHSHHEGQVGT